MWKLKKFPGETEHTLAASVELIATTRDKKPWSRPPLSMSFQVGEGWKGEGAAGRPGAAGTLQGRVAWCEWCTVWLGRPMRWGARSWVRIHPGYTIPSTLRRRPSPLQVPMHSASGVRVQYLKVWEKSSYKVGGSAARARLLS